MNNQTETDDILQKIIETEKRLKDYAGDDRCVTSFELVDIVHARKENREVVKIKSGIPRMDKLLTSFDGGELTVISGFTKHGKTLLAQTITRNISNDSVPALWFSYEVPAPQFLSQFGDTLPFFVLPLELRINDARWLRERIYEAIVKYKIKAVFIDNTHNILNLVSGDLTHRIDEFVKQLKHLAGEFNIHIFLLHHTIKGRFENYDAIGSDLLRDSSMIAQTADTIMFIIRDQKELNVAWVKITENRKNGVFNEYVKLVKVGNFFEEAIGEHNNPNTFRSTGKGFRRERNNTRKDVDD